MFKQRYLLQFRSTSIQLHSNSDQFRGSFKPCTTQRVNQLAISRRHYAHSQDSKGSGIDVDTLTIASLHRMLQAEETTVSDVCRAHLTRIRQLNPILTCITSLSAHCLEDAAALDAQLRSGAVSPASHPLLGVPVLLKDNFDVKGEATTAGCAALHANIAVENAPAVTALQRAGAIILGKTNMHELALEGLTVSSLAGQTRNPYDLSRTPGGSSGGSGAAVASGMCLLATGTDTVNSLRSPASACGIVSIRPTRGLVSTAGVQPVSWTQDAVGIMGRSVEDVAAGLDVIQEKSSCGRTRLGQTLLEAKDDRLGGKRFGLLTGFVNRQSLHRHVTCVNEMMDSTVASLRAAGSQVVEVSDARFSSERLLAELDTQRHEVRRAMDGYLQRSALNTGPRTLRSIFETRDFLVIPAQHEYMASALDPAYGPHSAAYAAIQQGILSLKQFVAGIFQQHSLDALIYPQQKNLVVPVGERSQAGRNGILAALCGLPSTCIPMGFGLTSDQAPRGVPVGLEILGRPFGEAQLLHLASQVEQLLDCRRTPLLAQQIRPRRAGMEQQDDLHVLATASREIPAAYAIGQLHA